MDQALGFAALMAATGVVHALGHLLAGSLAGARIEEISLGAGPAVWTLGRFRLRLLPVWACVLFEASDYEQLEPGRRLGISCAGPLANLAVAVSLLLVFGAGWGRIVTGPEFDVVHRVFPGSPAERAGLMPGDRVISLAGGTVTVDRAGQLLGLPIEPQPGPRPLGVKLRPSIRLEPLSLRQGLVYGLRLSGHLLLAPFRSADWESGLLHLPDRGALVGPSAWRERPVAGCLVGLATVQLWFFLLNLLPLPGTDAARAAIQLAQMAGIPIDTTVEIRLHQFGVMAFGTAYGIMLALLAIVG